MEQPSLRLVLFARVPRTKQPKLFLGECGASGSCPFGPLYCAPPLPFADLAMQLQLLLSYLWWPCTIYVSELLSVTLTLANRQKSTATPLVFWD